MRSTLYILLLLQIFNSCTIDTSGEGTPKYYIHTAHTRLFDTISQKVDPRIEQIDFSRFDMTLLGGDLCEETSKQKKTLNYVNALFDLSAPSTLWALGNHDNANNNWVTEITDRPIFYSNTRNNIVFSVLYTQENEDWMSTITGQQLDMLQAVADTIQQASHLFVLTHKLAWIMGHPELKDHEGQKNYDWSCNYTIFQTNWYKEVLPILRKVQDRGIQVICLAGDIGNNVRFFEERTEDGIYYLASGINPERNDAKILIFKHDHLSSMLDWQFINLTDFLKGGQKLPF